jgi:hypothetical protein
MEKNLEECCVKDLELPYEFKTNSMEGEVEVAIYETPKDSYFEDFKPYMYSVYEFNLIGDIEGSSTIKEIRKEIAEHRPKECNL